MKNYQHYKKFIYGALLVCMCATVPFACSKEKPCETKTYYLDADNDNFGDSAKTKTACTKPEGNYVLTGGDTNDGDDNVNPGCTKKFYEDADNDGEGDTPQAATTPTTPQAATTPTTPQAATTPTTPRSEGTSVSTPQATTTEATTLQTPTNPPYTRQTASPPPAKKNRAAPARAAAKSKSSSLEEKSPTSTQCPNATQPGASGDGEEEMCREECSVAFCSNSTRHRVCSAKGYVNFFFTQLQSVK